MAMIFKLRQTTVSVCASLKRNACSGRCFVCAGPHTMQSLRGGWGGVQGSCIELAFHLYSAVFGAAVLGWKGVALSLHSTCILLCSEVPSMHSNVWPCLRACALVDFRVGATRPTTLFTILEGEITHRPSFPQTSSGHRGFGGNCLAAGLPSRILPEHARPRLALMLHCVRSWHAQTPSVTTFVLKRPSSGQATMAQAKFN